MASFVTYLRVSTDKQGRSGLGLEAQRAAVAAHAASIGGAVVAEFVEVESGRKSNRAQLAAALAACRGRRAVLLIAKLDRLARNVAFVSRLMEAGVEFVAADMPTVNRLTIHILAAVAEEEARMISARTKAALTAAKARGVKLGNPNLQPGTRSKHSPPAGRGWLPRPQRPTRSPPPLRRSSRRSAPRAYGIGCDRRRPGGARRPDPQPPGRLARGDGTACPGAGSLTPRRNIFA